MTAIFHKHDFRHLCMQLINGTNAQAAAMIPIEFSPGMNTTLLPFENKSYNFKR